MSFPLDLGQSVIAFVVVWLAASVQASLGFGLALIAAPILLLMEPRLIPGPLMASGIALTLLIAIRERSQIDFGGVGFALGGRVFGTALAAVLLTAVSDWLFDLTFGGLVMLAIGLSVSGVRISPTPTHAAAAGALSGFMGTISAIGGPPLALLYQHESGPRIRATLSGYFVVGALMSIAALAAIGRFGAAEAWFTLYLIPPVVLGFVASYWGRRFVDRTAVRPLVLGLSFISALAVLIRALF